MIFFFKLFKFIIECCANSTEVLKWVLQTGGIEKLRDNLREAAVHHREIADRYELVAAGPIQIAEESEEVREERARGEASNARWRNRPHPDDISF